MSSKGSALSRIVDVLKEEVAADQQQREELNGLQLGIDELKQRNHENEQILHQLLWMRMLHAFMNHQVRFAWQI